LGEEAKILIKNIPENKVYSKDYFLRVVVHQNQKPKTPLEFSSSENSKIYMMHKSNS